ncbi:MULTISPECIES: barstar family protein [Proteus]|uniref:barstar family protein n=1 Tax=Proteus TaxID=583 RepID=UPI0006674956|nr:MULTISPECIES: barstar family protein [Proteus]EKW4662973.1 barstar family protein [Proteus mirabilis]ELB1686894.1 barstar family protein [Proteus mirabilis]MBG2947435.1 barstar family protein [Proteus mirabilis]MBI6393470.1 barstar family protein [Proteus mirabilis]MBI6506070.1 barstar family protein [Proteus mirabilis]
MNLIKLNIDFKNIKNVDDFHMIMKTLFGFPDFYGKNFNAFIDCLSSIRIPEDGMTSIHIKNDECILLEIFNINSIADDLLYDFLLSIQEINRRCVIFGEEASILLLPSKN